MAAPRSARGETVPALFLLILLGTTLGGVAQTDLSGAFRVRLRDVHLKRATGSRSPRSRRVSNFEMAFSENTTYLESV